MFSFIRYDFVLAKCQLHGVGTTPLERTTPPARVCSNIELVNATDHSRAECRYRPNTVRCGLRTSK